MNADSPSVLLQLIVAPALREKTVLVVALIAPFKSSTLKVLSLTVAVVNDENEFPENCSKSFPAVSNIFSSDAVPVISDTELAVFTPDVLLFKVIRVLASDTVVSVIVTDSVPILLIPFSVLAVADVSVADGSVPVVPVPLDSVPVSVG